MKLTFKIIALFFLAAAALIATSGFLSMQREVSFFQEEMAMRHAELARAIARQMRDEFPEPSELLFPADSGDGRQTVHWRSVWLDRSGHPATLPLTSDAVLQTAQVGEMVSLPVEFKDGGHLYCSYYILEPKRGRPVALELAESFSRRDAYTRGTLMRTLWQLIGLGIVAVLLVSLVGVRLVGRPLQALLRKTDRAARGDLLSTVHVKGSDELAELADALNRMCESLHQSQQSAIAESHKREAAVEQLRHADRLKTVGRLGAGIAHELGTPLNVVLGRASLIADGKVSGDDISSSAEVIRSEARRMTKLVEGLLDFARLTPAKREACDVATLVQETVSLLQAFAKKRRAEITTAVECTNCDAYLADCAQLRQVISNLVMNAILSKPNDARVQVVLCEASAVNPSEPDTPAQQCLVMRVIDDGDGIADTDLPHLFEPFFTTRKTGEGTGLGLSIAHGIVSEHGGWITVDSQPGNGSCFSVFLPRPQHGELTAGESS